VIASATRFLRDVLRSFTWQKLLLVQLLAVALDVFVLLINVTRTAAPPSFTWSRVIIAETMAFCVLLALLVADQFVARGVRQFRAYALAIVTASMVSGFTQFEIRSALGIYTRLDRPGVDASVRRTQMIYAACDTLTYGVIFIVVYLDYRRRERLLRRVRAAELERARSEQSIVRSQLTALRTDVNAVELLATLEELRRGFDANETDADVRLDGVIASLRQKLTPIESARHEAPA
jgi:hypothetical protein